MSTKPSLEKSSDSSLYDPRHQIRERTLYLAKKCAPRIKKIWSMNDQYEYPHVWPARVGGPWEMTPNEEAEDEEDYFKDNTMFLRTPSLR